MKARHAPLEPARLTYDAQGVPAALQYGDVYHSRGGAVQQAHHVFLQGNGLPQRWRGQDTFTVCETGFGLGNNFLALWQLWRGTPQRPQRLHMLSFEAHPFSGEDLAAALAGHEGELRELADLLLQAWPLPLPGLHRLEFDGGRVTLTLGFGRVEHLARQVEARVDAFFLDGFAPQVNPQMWSRSLFGQLVRIANQGATAASWCSAGQVRRDLAAAGFVVKRAPGFGGKWHMTRAVLRPNLGQLPPQVERDHVIVVGSGFAGAGVAHSLALRGHAVTLFDPAFRHGLAGTHLGHHSAAMTPAFSRDDNPMCRLSRAGILLAHLRWAAFPNVLERCGSLLRVPECEEAQWQQGLVSLALPTQWARWCHAADTPSQVGLALPQGGVWLEAGAMLRPGRLITALLAHPAIHTVPQPVAAVRLHGTDWQAISGTGAVMAEAPRLVLAAGAETPALLGSAVPLERYGKLSQIQRMAGQVGYFKSGGVPDTHAIIAGAGYWLPQREGVHTGGSTYEFDARASEPTSAGFRAVAEKVSRLLDIDGARLEAARAQPDGWAGWRAAVSDHLPVIGPIDKRESLWVACAYGSRGLSWMSLAGEIMAARLNAEPQVVERELLKSMCPR